MMQTNNATKLYVLCCVFLYAYNAYFLERTDFLALLFSFGILFFFTYKIIQIEKNNFNFLILISLLFRLLFIFSLPNLSQDFYRFIWDGRLILLGLNPFTNLPNDLILDPNFTLSQAHELVGKMGNLSASHFSNYPPINQLFFVVAGFFSNHSILGGTIVLRTIIIVADFGTLYFGSKLLEKLGLEKHRIFWFLLNPLVIIELTGNLHFEGVMLFFFIWSIYLLQENKWRAAALIMALSISTKLLPLLLLPLFFQKLGWKKSFTFYGIIIGINILLFVPFFSAELISNYSKTIGLWFTNFEFNASIYYIIRAIGYYFKGYNIIQSTGQVIPVLMMVFIVFQSFFGKNKTTLNLFQSFLLVLSVYFFTATTVHPWYIINLVLISVFTNFKFPIVWSLMVVVSYYTYSNPAFKENLWLIAIEYIVVALVLFNEMKKTPFIIYSIFGTRIKMNERTGVNKGA
ncbi:mannosyltransferase [Flavobacterium sp.]|uniref:mannosyltransferase n=1 Tax=Flavobacterium sp. TaxID=239 RepID=UPI0037533D61